MTSVHVEYAHGALDAPAIGGLKASVKSVNVLLGELAKHPIEVRTGVLVDDKRVDPADRTKLAEAYFGSVEKRPHYYAFERDLIAYKEKLLDLLAGRPRRRAARSIDRYLTRGGTLPCSVDIAIWHLIRLGVLADDAGLLRSFAGSDTPFTLGGAPDFVISVLNIQEQEQEDLADKEILDHIDIGPDLAAQRVLRIYYPESLSYSSCGSYEDIETQVTQTLEILHAYNSGN